MTNGNFNQIWGDALNGMIAGGVSGAVVGGIAGGVSSYLKGENIWTGKANPTSIEPHRPQNPQPDAMPTKPQLDKQITQQEEILQSVSYDIEVNQTNLYSGVLTDGKSFNINRPKIRGYDIRIDNQMDKFHDFPRLLDSDIIKYGHMEQVGNTAGFIAEGHLNGIAGYYNINVNMKTGMIFHRLFYSIDNRYQIYIKDANGNPWFFFKK